MLKNGVSYDDTIKVLWNAINGLLFSTEIFAIILLNCINSSLVSLSRSIL